MGNAAVPALIGLGGGFVIGYFVKDIIDPDGVLPQIVLTVGGVQVPGNQLPVGTVYDMICLRFPPNAQLVAPQTLAPPAIVNLGITDGDGKLVVSGNTVQGPAATYYIIAWNATDGKYCAMTTLIAT